MKLGQPVAEKCPLCQKHFKNTAILITHLNERHELTFTATVTPDGRGLQLMPLPVQPPGYCAPSEVLESKAGEQADAIDRALGENRRSTSNSNISSVVDALRDSDSIFGSTASASSGMSPLNSSVNVQRPPFSLDPNAMDFQPMQFRLPALPVGQEAGQEMRRPSTVSNVSLDLSNLSITTEESYGMIGQSSSGGTPVVSPVNSVFSSPLLRHSTPQAHPLLPPSSPNIVRRTPVADEAVDHARSDGDIVSDPGNRTHKFLTGRPCNAQGEYLASGQPPEDEIRPAVIGEDLSPFQSRLQLEITELSYCDMDMAPANFDKLMRFWTLPTNSSSASAHHSPPFKNHSEMLQIVDSISISDDLPWIPCTFGFNNTPGIMHVGERAPWMDIKPEGYYRDARKVAHKILSDSSFANSFDTTPYRRFDGNGVRQFDNLFSADWCWKESDKIVALGINEVINGAMLVPILLGSNTAVISFGEIEYEPIFMSVGNLHNGARQYCQDAVLLLGFLAYPKSDRKDQAYVMSRCQLRHTFISHALEPLRPFTTTPDVVRCPDRHFRRAMYSIGPHIADYKTQIELGGTEGGWCSLCILPPRTPAFKYPKSADFVTFRKTSAADNFSLSHRLSLRKIYGMVTEINPYTSQFTSTDICDILVPDISSQVIVSFKNNLRWLIAFILTKNGETYGRQILAELDRRIALAPWFSGICRHYLTRDLELWTEDELLGLMKIILPCLVGLVSNKVLLTFRNLLDCIYLIRSAVISGESIAKLERSLDDYIFNRSVFKLAGISNDFSEPQEHSLIHVPHYIRQFGALSHLTCAFTEADHKEAMYLKEPYNPAEFDNLYDMLLRMERITKIGAMRQLFVHSLGNGISSGLNGTPPEVDVTFGAQADSSYPNKLFQLVLHTGTPHLPELVREFWYTKFYSRLNDGTQRTIPDTFFTIDHLNENLILNVYHSAKAIFRSPSDSLRPGENGMRSELIWSTTNYENTGPRRDCVFISEDPESPDLKLKDLKIARVYMFFSMVLHGSRQECALIQWYNKTRYLETPDNVTDMYEVRPDTFSDGRPRFVVIHLHHIVRAAHLMPRFGKNFLRFSTSYMETLDRFNVFFLNRFIDQHSHEHFM